MRNALLFSFIFAGALTLAAQTPSPAPAKPSPAPASTPAKQTPPPAATAPAKPAPAPATAGQTPTTGTGTPKPRSTSGTRASTPAPARSGITLRVSDMGGRMLEGVQVDVQGPTPRRDSTNAFGQVNFASLQAGTYRLTFSGDKVTTFEREVTVGSGKIGDYDIALNPAPPPREIIKEVAPATPPPAPASVVGPPGQAQLTSLYDLAESELKSKTPRREMLVACSGNLRTTMILLADKEQSSLPKRMYDAAEVSYYVLGGEATMRVGTEEKNLAAGGYAAIPRGTPVTIVRKGNKPLSLLSVLSGEPCEQAK
jgi:mannose-6-phosphate isomerase-like protein (cupin superfamily)